MCSSSSRESVCNRSDDVEKEFERALPNAQSSAASVQLWSKHRTQNLCAVSGHLHERTLRDARNLF